MSTTHDFATAIAAVLGVLLARIITRPTRRLAKGAEEIGRGGHSLRLREHRTDRGGAQKK